MKKTCIGLCIIATAAWAAFHSSTTLTAVGERSSWAVTNVGQTAWTPTAIEWKFSDGYQGTCQISRVRGGVTNLLVRQVLTNLTHNVFMTKEEFEGTWFIRGDVLLMEQPGASNLVINLNRDDSYEP